MFRLWTRSNSRPCFDSALVARLADVTSRMSVRCLLRLYGLEMNGVLRFKFTLRNGSSPQGSKRLHTVDF
jgi:hypothetical protein